MKKKEKKDALLTSINKNKKCHSEHQGLTHYTYFLSIESRKIEINSSKIPKEIQQPEIADKAHAPIIYIYIYEEKKWKF